MEHIKTFLDNITFQAVQANVILNNKSQIQASGKLSEYKRLLNTCKFKLIAYFDVDKWGRPYTIAEKKQAQHRRHIPSNDKVRNVINEELSFNILIDYCLKNAKNLDSAMIIIIDKLNSEEITVFKFDAQNISLSKFTQMQFKTDEFGNTYYIKCIEPPIRVDKMRNNY